MLGKFRMHTFSVCVYCGSRLGARPRYAEAAEELGRGLAQREWRLVYGAGDIGLMGTVARPRLQAARRSA
jgi:predicted Rossmann-fold nucleotide-binding protein